MLVVLRGIGQLHERYPQAPTCNDRHHSRFDRQRARGCPAV